MDLTLCSAMVGVLLYQNNESRNILAWYTTKAVEKMKADEKLSKEIDEFHDAFSNGVFAIPRNPKDPRVKVRALWDYCKEKGVDPKDLTQEDMEQFLEY